MAKKYLPGETKEQRKLRKQIDKGKIKNPKTINKPLPKPVAVIETKTQPKFEEPTYFDESESVAFVLGNGTSRSTIDPHKLKRHGKIYGCNALYREFVPDVLVAVDTKMIREISAVGYHLKYPVWTNPNRYTKEIVGLNLFNPNLGWSSGPSALNLASKDGFKKIYILGFDYEGIGKQKELVNNIYAGTENYKKVNERATYFGNWQRQTGTCIQRHPKVKYIRVIPDAGSFVPENLIGLQNLTHITIDNFKNRFNL